MSEKPWYKSVYRWGQTNLTEIDPLRYDNQWWKKYWRETNIQGIIVNAGGIVAYYPTKFAAKHRAKHLGDRDLLGEIIMDARKENLAVLARMDSNRVHEPFYLEHPEWTARNKKGEPYRAGDLYVECINSPYYTEFLPQILEEIITKYKPEGITDNSWNGLDRENICYCNYCQKNFYDEEGYELPKKKDWENKIYRKWIEWSYRKRLEIWDLNNRVTKNAGGQDCLWLGMIGGDMVSQSKRFRDMKEISERADMLMLDMQARNSTSSFYENGEAGKTLHNLLGWDKLIPESMAMYQAGQPTFRKASKPEPEAKMWVLEGFAGSIQPWWHHIGAYHQDRRQYETTKPLFKWHKENQDLLINREPVASVGLVWSQRNTDFYGRDKPEERVKMPWKGFSQVLTRNNIPYLPVHIDNIENNMDKYSLLILPNLAVMSGDQAQTIREFINSGGSVIATGETSLYNKWGDQREDFLLSDIFQVHSSRTNHGSFSGEKKSWDDSKLHSYLRLFPEIRKKVDGPRWDKEPEINGTRHQILSGFEKTDIIPFGGSLHAVQRAENVKESDILFKFLPPFPIYPPETSWMRNRCTSLPGLIINDHNPGKAAYLPADLDRCYARDYLPDHGNLLKNIIHWALEDDLPMKVRAPGYIDCHLYRKQNKFILHLINLTGCETWRAPVHELIETGPVSVFLNQELNNIKIKVDSRVLKNNASLKNKNESGEIEILIDKIIDHELVVIEKI